jgi:uncharacterized Fe-S cluster-containing MiaB family protein
LEGKIYPPNRSKIAFQIIQAELRKQRFIKAVEDEANKEITYLKKQCEENGHKYDDGESALKQAGHPWHSGWDVCQICGHYIETNEYGR